MIGRTYHRQPCLTLFSLRVREVSRTLERAMSEPTKLQDPQCESSPLLRIGTRRYRRSTMVGGPYCGRGGDEFGWPLECGRRTKPEPDPPPIADPMDFIGSCEGRWQRNEVSKSNKGRAGFDGHEDRPTTGPRGQEHRQ